MPRCTGDVFSDNPNAPCLDPSEYAKEKIEFVALMIGVMLYGVTIVLFFQSLRTLLYPTRGRVMWGLVVHTVTMFLCLTISVAIELVQVVPFNIDDREDGTKVPSSDGIWGPWVYQQQGSDWGALTVLSFLTFPLNQGLADGLLLYRCYVIYAGNYLVIFPGLMYIATVVLAAMCLCENLSSLCRHYDIPVRPYTATCVALNVLLTLMIIARLVRHSRSIRSALGTSAGVTGVYTTVAVILTEACTPYAVTFLMYLVLSGHNAIVITSTLVTRFQVIGPFLIIVRIAARRAVTSNMTSGGVDSIRFRSQETSTSDSGALADENPAGLMTRKYDEAPGTPNIWREAGTEGVPL